jgi:hypothetical protein
VQQTAGVPATCSGQGAAENGISCRQGVNSTENVRADARGSGDPRMHLTEKTPAKHSPGHPTWDLTWDSLGKCIQRPEPYLSGTVLVARKGRQLCNFWALVDVLQLDMLQHSPRDCTLHVPLAYHGRFPSVSKS